MKISIRHVLAILLLVLSGQAIAGGNESDCKLIGSWYGYDEDGTIWWMSTADGQNASHGTLNLEIPGAVHLFEDAFAITELKGQWKKTGSNTYDWTVIGYPLDENTASLLIAKVSGTDVMSEDCDAMWVTNIVMEVFFPYADINTDTPIDVDTSFPDHPGFRIKVDLPELLP